MATSNLKILVLYCALVNLAHVTERAGQMHDLYQQLAKAARELSRRGRPGSFT